MCYNLQNTESVMNVSRYCTFDYSASVLFSAPSVIITRSAPISSIFRLKKLPSMQLTTSGIITTGGLQLRTLTAEVCIVLCGYMYVRVHVFGVVLALSK